MLDPKDYQAIGWILICVAAACFALHQIAQFIRSWAPKPSASEVREEAQDKFFSRTEALPRLQKIDSSLEELGKRITLVDSSRLSGENAMREAIHAMELRLLEAGTTRQKEVIEHIDRLTGEIFNRLSRSEPTIAANSADIAHLQGDVERLQSNAGPSLPR